MTSSRGAEQDGPDSHGADPSGLPAAHTVLVIDAATGQFVQGYAHS